MELAGTDPDFRSETVAETVRKTCRAVLVDTGGVHESHEFSRGIRIFRDDAVSVMRSVSVDMMDRFIDVIDYFDGKDIVQVLRLKILFFCRIAVDHHGASYISAVLDLTARGVGQCRDQHIRDILVYQQCFHSIAGSHVLGLGIYDDRHGFFDGGSTVYVDVTDAVSMPHYRDLGIVHDVLHELVGAARDEKIYIIVTFQQFIYAGTVFDEDSETFRKPCLRGGLIDGVE